MKVLIIGGTQFIGKEITRQCLDAGHQVVLFNRGKTPCEFDVPVIKGNIHTFTESKDELRAVKADVVIHCICFTPQQGRDCIEVFEGSDCHLIILSSMDCYDMFVQSVKGLDSCDFLVNEESPTSRIEYYWKGTSHGLADEYDKNIMTDIIMEAGRAGEVKPTIFRLPMVYGPGDHQFAIRFGMIIRRIYDKRSMYPLGAIQQSNLWTYGYVTNIAAAIVHAIDCTVTFGKIYNLAEQKFRSFRRWVELFANAARFHFDFQVLPDELISQESEMNNSQPLHLLVDSSLYGKETGFISPVDIKEAIQMTLYWGLEHPDSLGELPDYEGEKQMVKDYQQYLKKYKQNKVDK